MRFAVVSVAVDEGTTFAGQGEPPIIRAAGRDQRHANGFQKDVLSFDGFRPFPQCDSFSAPVRRPHHLHPPQPEFAGQFWPAKVAPSKPRSTAVELAQHGIGEFAVDLDVFLARDRVGPLAVGWACVGQDAAKEIGQEVGQQLLLFEAVCPACGEQLRPVRQLGRGGLPTLQVANPKS